MIITFLALCFATGGIFLNIHAANLPTEVELAEGVRYNYLSNPRLLVADSSNIYIINENTLLKISRGTGQTVPTMPTPSLTPNAIDISIANNRIFVFWETSFNVYSLDLILLNTVTGLPSSRVFAVEYKNNQYNVYHANTDVLYIRGYNASLSNSPASIQYFSGQAINSISTANNTVYVLAGSTFSRIYDAGTTNQISELNNDYYLAHSLSYIGNNMFTLIGGITPTLYLYDQAKDTKTEVPIGNPNVMNLSSNYDPVHVFALSQTEIFVIDGIKHSIDQYAIENNALTFKFTIAAHCGDDNGFYFDPLALCTLDDGRYLVADHAGIKLTDKSKEPKDQTTLLLPRLGTNSQAPTVEAIAFDYYKHIYTYDSNKTIRKYELRGSNTLVLAPNQPVAATYGKIVQLVAAPDQSIYAIDSQNHTIWKISESGTVTHLALHPSVSITSDTRAAIFETTMYLINPNVTIDLENPDNIQPAPIYTAMGTTLVDIIVDYLGAVNILSKTGTVYFLNDDTLTNANVSASPDLNIDRIAGTVMWLGKNHSVQSTTIPAWSPMGKSEYKWNESDPVEALSYADAESELFIKTIQPAILYSYPNAIGAKIQLQQNTVLKVLKYDAEVGDKTFAYSYVLYETEGSEFIRGAFHVGYIAHALTSKNNVKYYADSLGFINSNGEQHNHGRVILDAVIYKYPTSICIDSKLKLGEIIPLGYNLFEDAAEPGLEINREIIIRDYRGWMFYEIRLNNQNKPDPNGDNVGYVSKLNVIDSYMAPSLPKFNPNARVMLFGGLKSVFAYADDGGTTETASLNHKQEIRIIGKLEKTQKYTHIQYNNGYGDYYGYIETIYIKPDGLSTLQIIGLSTLFFILAILMFLVSLHLKLRKKKVKGEKLL